MGRRRDRSKQGASRRVKIDLSVDEEDPSPPPPGNAGGGEATAANSDGHLSPSSKPALKEDPLGLLGRYSDDEDKPAAANESQIDAQVKDFIADLETSGLLETEKTEPSVQQDKVETEPCNLVKPPSSAPKPANAAARRAAAEIVAKPVRNVVSETTIVRQDEDAKWRAIFDQASGDYYYWNTETGISTWQKPDSFVVDEPSQLVAPQSYGTTSYGVYDPVVNGLGHLEGALGVDYTTPDSVYTYTQSTALIQLAETIASRFKLLAGGAASQSPMKVRLLIEAEIRLSDCKALAASSDVSSFWVHTEAQLRRLERLLAVEEAVTPGNEKQPVAIVDSSDKDNQSTEMEVDMDLEPEEDSKRQSASCVGVVSECSTAPPPEFGPPLPPEPETMPPEKTKVLPNSDTTASNGAGSSPRSETPSSAVLIAEAAAAAKNAAKMARLKKRNSANTSLQANKKISSLVNKWNAAKEELHPIESDDAKALYDPQALERKRQKGIEEWRRDQIASGQALDNANFQPLQGMDWRERVKLMKKS